jgi:hypothetical protein
MSSSSNRTSFWHPRLQAAGIHLGLSLCVAALAGLLVFAVWYPYPYREISGGRELFVILVSVDVVLGPLITLAVFDAVKKPWKVLRRDLAVVALLQLAALGYGMWTVFVARPVYLVFEYHRFNVVHAIDVPEDLLPRAAPGLQKLPLWGPGRVSLRDFKTNDEKADMTMAAIAGGIQLQARPDLWQAYETAAPQIRKEGKPVAQLKTRFPVAAPHIDALLAKHGPAAQGFVHLPMVGRKTFWTVIVDPSSLEIKEYLPLDSF